MADHLKFRCDTFIVKYSVQRRCLNKATRFITNNVEYFGVCDVHKISVLKRFGLDIYFITKDEYLAAKLLAK